MRRLLFIDPPRFGEDGRGAGNAHSSPATGDGYSPGSAARGMKIAVAGCGTETHPAARLEHHDGVGSSL